MSLAFTPAANVPIEGMTVTPLYYGTDEWEILFGGAWVSLINFAIGEPEARAEFEQATGLGLESLLNRSPINRMVDTATGYEQKLLCAFCDWVTTTLWGVAEPVLP